jgi:hypothetical protein
LEDHFCCRIHENEKGAEKGILLKETEGTTIARINFNGLYRRLEEDESCQL